MTVINSEYADILKKNRILYVPSCIVIEMLNRLYSQVSMIDLSGNLRGLVPDLLVLVQRLNLNLRSTGEAYRESRIKFFIGDWNHDKRRARKLFFNLMSRLGYLGELVGKSEKELLYKAIEDMGREWGKLDRIMERKCRNSECQRQCGSCRDLPEYWQQMMANTLLSLEDPESGEDAGSYLFLLCYKRIKDQLLKDIDELETRRGSAAKFPPERVLCISEEDLPLTCHRCLLIPNERKGTEVIRQERRPSPTTIHRRVQPQKAASQPAKVSRTRYLMPTSLADIHHPR